MTGHKLILFCVLSLCMMSGRAETNYVVDQLMIGLHKDSTTDSPIVKLVPSGTALEILSRENDLVRVREPEGTTGWVHQRYLIATPPDNTRLLELQKRNTALEKEIQQLQSGARTVASGDNKELEQQLNSERLKVGELQAQLADLKANLGTIDDNDELLEELERLRQANNELVSQLAMAGIETPKKNTDPLLNTKNWKVIAIALLCLFALGAAAGAFLLDYINRRRHGGFRV